MAGSSRVESSASQSSKKREAWSVTVSGQYRPLPSLNSPLEVGAPQIIGKRTFRQRRSARAVGAARRRVGHGVDGAASLAALQAKHGPLPQTLEAESPSGSVHR